MRPAPDAAPFTPDEIEGLFADLGAALPGGTGSGALLAVSGGSDSLALLDLTRRWRDADPGARARLAVATVDHGLREGSAAEASAVGAHARAVGFDHATLVWDGPKPATAIQDAARAARYRLLAAEAHRRGLASIVTAHTRDDQAETVLMRLARGSGVRGLAGMQAQRPEGGLALRRPLLTVSRARLRAHLTGAGIAWIDDPSNADARFLRPRLRRLLPALAAEGLDAARLSSLAHRMRRADAALDHAAVAFEAAHVRGMCEGARAITIEAAAFACAPLEIRMRVLSNAVTGTVPAAHAPADASLEDLAEALALAHAQGLRLGRTLAGARIVLARGTITVTRAPARRSGDGLKTTPR